MRGGATSPALCLERGESMANVLDLIAKKFESRIRYETNSVTSTVGITATRILGNNPGRLAVVLCNLGSVSVYVAPSQAVSSSYGICVPAAGVWSLEWQEDYLLPILEWYAVASEEVSVYILELLVAGEGS